MERGRIGVITGSLGTGKTTAAAIAAKESGMEKSVHMHTDDFYHYLSKGAIPPHLPESNEQNVIDTTQLSVEDTAAAIKERIANRTALLCGLPLS